MPSSPPSGTGDRTLASYAFVLYRRRYILLLVVGSALLATVLLNAVLPRIYEAYALVFPISGTGETAGNHPSSSPRAAAVQLAPSASMDLQSSYLGILKSDAVLDTAARRLGRTLRQVRRNIHVQITGEYLIEIKSRERTHADALALAQAVVGAFSDTLQDFRRGPLLAAAASLSNQLQVAATRLEAARMAVRDLQSQTGSASIAEETSLLLAQKIDRQSQRHDVANQIRQARAQVAQLKLEIGQLDDSVISSEQFAASPEILTLRQSLADLQVKRSAATVDLTSEHPEVQRIDAQIAEATTVLTGAVAQTMSVQTHSLNPLRQELLQRMVGLQVDLQALEAKEQGLQQSLEAVESRLKSIPELGLRMTMLIHNSELLQSSYDELSRLYDGAVRDLEKDVPVLVVAQPPLGSNYPSFPRLPVNLLIALPLALALGVFYCFALDYLERLRLASVQDEQMFGDIPPQATPPGA